MKLRLVQVLAVVLGLFVGFATSIKAPQRNHAVHLTDPVPPGLLNISVVTLMDVNHQYYYAPGEHLGEIVMRDRPFKDMAKTYNLRGEIFDNKMQGTTAPAARSSNLEDTSIQGHQIYIVKLHKDLQENYKVVGVTHAAFEAQLHDVNAINARRRRMTTEDESVDVSVQIHHRYNHVFHGIAVSGLLVDQGVLEGLDGVHSVRKDTIRHISIPWNLDRVDQADLPLSNSYTYSYAGVGVDIYVVDTGLDVTHREFYTEGVAYSRTVANIWNSYGSATADNTDDNNHGDIKLEPVQADYNS